MPVTRSVLVPLPAVIWGGLQTFSENINSELRNAGWRWIVVVPENAIAICRRLRESGVEAVSMPLSRLRRSTSETLHSLVRMPNELRAIARFVCENEIDIVQAVGAHHPHGLVISSLARRPLVWQLHSNILPSALRPIVGKIIAQSADAIMTNGMKIADDFWGHRQPVNRPITFYAPVDARRFEPSVVKRAAARAELGYTAKEVVVGTIGNRVRQKNHEMLVAVAEQLSPLYPHLRICIMGANQQDYQERYRATVMGPAHALNQGRPRYIQFVDPGARVDELIHAIDIFVLTSRSEGVPIALFEAMSATKPVISVDVGAISEVVVENETGFLAHASDGATLALRVRELVASDSLRIAMGLAGRRRILEEFSLANVVAAHVKAYEQAMRVKRSRNVRESLSNTI